jgi:hypothetical protein
LCRRGDGTLEADRHDLSLEPVSVDEVLQEAQGFIVPLARSPSRAARSNYSVTADKH